MRLDDFNRLKKFMNLTFSDNDAEALAALRQANKILAREKLDWDKVMNKLVQIEGPEIESAEDAAPTSFGEARHIARIDAMFGDVLETASGTFRDFILDLDDQWRKKRWLSPAQMSALTTAAKRARSAAR